MRERVEGDEQRGYRCTLPSREQVCIKALHKKGEGKRGRGSLEDGAAFPLGATASLDERCTGGVLKHLANTLAGLGGALEVADGADLLSDGHALLGRDGALAGLAELLDNLGVVAEILLASDEDDGQVLAEVEHFRDPLFLDVVERVGRVDGKADEDDVRVRVGERTETVVVFLTGGIPERELDMTAVDLDVGNVVLEDGRDVDLGEGTLFEEGVMNETRMVKRLSRRGRRVGMVRHRNGDKGQFRGYKCKDAEMHGQRGPRPSISSRDQLSCRASDCAGSP